MTRRAPDRRAIATAPMRVSFAGGGSDQAPFKKGVGGRVVGTAIAIPVRAEVEPLHRDRVRLEVVAGTLAPPPFERGAGDAPSTDLAFRLLEAVLREAGVDRGVRLRVETSVVPGAGLGGSASAAVAALAALRASVGETIEPMAIAEGALVAERDGLGIVCGLQDPLFAVLGGTLDLAFDDTGACVRWSRVDVDPTLARALEAGLFLVDTELRRVSGDVLGRMDPSIALATAEDLVRAADEVARGIEARSLERVLEGMIANAATKLRRDPSASAAAADLARRLGERGARVVRMCGAGAGGHVLVWAPPDTHAAVIDELGASVVRRPATNAAGVRVETA